MTPTLTLTLTLTPTPPQLREDMASFVTRELLQPQQVRVRLRVSVDPNPNPTPTPNPTPNPNPNPNPTPTPDPDQGWMRAQSLLDPAAARSDRTDHGPWGSYSGWPAITAAALAALGQQRSGLGVLRRAAALTQRGPWGQAHALHRAGDGHGKGGSAGGKAGRGRGRGRVRVRANPNPNPNPSPNPHQGGGGAAYKPFEFTLYNEAVG